MSSSTQAGASSKPAIPVTVENFIRAESDLYFGNIIALGGFGKFYHFREPTPLDRQTVVRMNRDTLYSGGVFDLDAGPVTITMPDAGKRFMSLEAFDEDEYVHGVSYGAGARTFTRKEIGHALCHVWRPHARRCQ
jgi:hypothetical protein